MPPALAPAAAKAAATIAEFFIVEKNARQEKINVGQLAAIEVMKTNALIEEQNGW